jgi:hypothetical protein
VLFLESFLPRLNTEVVAASVGRAIAFRIPVGYLLLLGVFVGSIGVPAVWRGIAP